MLNLYERASKALLASNAVRIPVEATRLKIDGFKWAILSKAYAKDNGLLEGEFLESYAKTYSNFVLRLSNGSHAIIVDERCPMVERNYIIAHEIGHIVCGHTSLHGILGKSSDDRPQNPQEREADAFALLLLAPPCILNNYGISEYEDIMKFTGVSEEHAKQIAGELQRYRRTKKTETENALCEKFNRKVVCIE